MSDYSKECIKVFLKEQRQLFDEKVAENEEEAEEFLTDVMAVELASIQEVKEFLDEYGMDITGMSDEEIASQDEVFAVPGGRFLVVAG